MIKTLQRKSNATMLATLVMWYPTMTSFEWLVNGDGATIGFSEEPPSLDDIVEYISGKNAWEVI